MNKDHGDGVSKTRTRCKEMKPISGFYPKGKGKTHSWCKECYKERHHAYYLQRKDYQIERQRKRKKEIRDWVRGLKENKQCSICGESHPACLQYHHEDPSKKEIEIGKMAEKHWGKARMEKEVAKCVILCANCHFKLHWAG